MCKESSHDVEAENIHAVEVSKRSSLDVCIDLCFDALFRRAVSVDLDDSKIDYVQRLV